MLNIEITGTGNHNKGAEMMLLTIVNELKSSKRTFIVQPISNNDGYSFYSSLGLYPKVNISLKGIDISFLLNLLPARIKKRYGFYYDSDIQVVLDASGFAYSDQWGLKPAKKFLRKLTRWEKNNVKVIMLPQAFGPFNQNKLRKTMIKILNKVRKVYARDAESYNYMLNLTNGNNPKLRKYPDFTCLLKGKIPIYFDENIHQICIVPNYRILDKTQNIKEYISAMIYFINQFKKNNLSPYFLICGGEEDYKMAESINNKMTDGLEIIEENNPILFKGLISKSIAIIGSRYHALATGLDSGVPSFGFGWSHKYKELFEEYKFNEGYLSFPINDDQLNMVLKKVLSKEIRNKIKENLEISIIEKIKLSKKLFKEIDNELKLLEN